MSKQLPGDLALAAIQGRTPLIPSLAVLDAIAAILVIPRVRWESVVFYNMTVEVVVSDHDVIQGAFTADGRALCPWQIVPEMLLTRC